MPSSTKDIIQGSSFKALFVGPNGSGKTVGASSIHLLKGFEKIHFSDFDGRLEPIKKKYPNADISYDNYGSRSYDKFREFIDSQTNRPDYDAYVIDSLTSLTMSNVMWQLRLKGQLGSGKKTKTGLPVTSFDEINVETVLVSELMENIKVLYETYGKSIIMTAHPISKTFIGEAGGGISNRYESLAAYGNKVPSLVPGFFNEIYFFEEVPAIMSGEKNKYIVRTQKTNTNNLAKTALNIPSEIEWTNKDLFPLLNSYIKEDISTGIEPGKPLPGTITL